MACRVLLQPRILACTSLTFDLFSLRVHFISPPSRRFSLVPPRSLFFSVSLFLLFFPRRSVSLSSSSYSYYSVRLVPLSNLFVPLRSPSFRAVSSFLFLKSSSLLSPFMSIFCILLSVLRLVFRMSDDPFSALNVCYETASVRFASFLNLKEFYVCGCRRV